jgi:hypothetical protein
MKTHLSLILVATALSACISAPNTPSVILSTSKTPEQYVDCVYPKWKTEVVETTRSERRKQFKVVAPSRLAADQILEVHAKPVGSEISLYLRRPLVLEFGKSSLETAANTCL